MIFQNLISLFSQSSMVSQCSEPPSSDCRPFFELSKLAKDVTFNVGYYRNNPFIRMIGLCDHQNYQYAYCGRFLLGFGRKILYDMYRRCIFTIQPDIQLGTKMLVLNVTQTGRQFRICRQRALPMFLGPDIVVTEIRKSDEIGQPSARRHNKSQEQIVIRTEITKQKAFIIDRISERVVCTVYLKRHKSGGLLVDNLTMHEGVDPEFCIVLALCRDEICSLSSKL